MLALARFSEWGRQFRRISGDYFALRRSVRPFLWLAAIVFMTLFSVRLNILVSYWYNGFYSAMQALDGEAFWRMLVVFSVLATIHVLRSLADFYLRQAFMIHWRIWAPVLASASTSSTSSASSAALMRSARPSCARNSR